MRTDGTTNSGAAAKRIFSTGARPNNVSSGPERFWLNLNGWGKLRFYLGSSNYTLVNSGVVIENGQWHMVTCTFYSPSSGVTPGTTAWTNIMDASTSETTHGMRWFINGALITGSDTTGLTSALSAPTGYLGNDNPLTFLVDDGDTNWSAPAEMDLNNISIHDSYTCCIT